MTTYLLINYIPLDKDSVFVIDQDGREPAEFRKLEPPLSFLTVPKIEVVGFIDGLPGLTGTDYSRDHVLLHRILHYALSHADEHDKTFLRLWKTSCEAAGVNGLAAALVLCNDGRVRKLVANSNGEHDFVNFDETTLYQQGRVLSKMELLNQLNAKHQERVAAIEGLFDPLKTDGFVMPDFN